MWTYILYMQTFKEIREGENLKTDRARAKGDETM